MTGKLLLKDGLEIEGKSFGAPISASGEVVFSTGMVGYPESFTDPSYLGQILVLTYPIIGNYGVAHNDFWESDNLQISGLIVSNYIDTPSHFQSKQTLAEWLKKEQIPGLEIKDTRLLTQHLREKGTILGKMVIEKPIEWYDPNEENLVASVSTKKVTRLGSGRKTVLLIDCGSKRNIRKSLLKRGVSVLTVPWNYDPFDSKEKSLFDAIVISNGPGDPKMAKETISIIQKALLKRIPLLGICLGHQLLSLAAGGDTKKLKYGHRSQNQPCVRSKSEQCYITTQNHGFHVADIPKGFLPWFENANDGTNEGIIHKKYPVMSVQFHPEATPGPQDTEWIFDFFLKKAGIQTI